MLGIQVISALLNFPILILSPPQALRISLGGEWETQVTGNETQGTMERRRKRGYSFPPSLAPKFSSREGETSGYEAGSGHCRLTGSLSNDDGDGNENVEKAIGLLKLAKLHPCTCITLFDTFLYRHCTSTA